MPGPFRCPRSNLQSGSEVGVGEDSGWEAWANGAGRGSDLSEGGWNTVILRMSSRQDQARRPEELKERETWPETWYVRNAGGRSCSVRSQVRVTSSGR